jgi:hypothetical protein
VRYIVQCWVVKPRQLKIYVHHSSRKSFWRRAVLKFATYSVTRRVLPFQHFNIIPYIKKVALSFLFNRCKPTHFWMSQFNSDALFELERRVYWQVMLFSNGSEHYHKDRSQWSIFLQHTYQWTTIRRGLIGIWSHSNQRALILRIAAWATLVTSTYCSLGRLCSDFGTSLERLWDMPVNVEKDVRDSDSNHWHLCWLFDPRKSNPQARTTTLIFNNIGPTDFMASYNGWDNFAWTIIRSGNWSSILRMWSHLISKCNHQVYYRLYSSKNTWSHKVQLLWEWLASCRGRPCIANYSWDA